jgi:hypothetical protein
MDLIERMTSYIVLLRAVNVGGTGKLVMADLSWTLSLKRHSKVPPLSVGITGVEFLFGLAFSRTV